MSDETPQTPDQNPDQPAENGAAESASTPSSMPTTSGRATSVRFRSDADMRDQARASMRMDGANEALADALRIAFRLVQIGMGVLVILYFASSFKMIKEGERGLKIKLGKIQEGNLEKGPHWALPYPLGEIVPIGAGSLELRLETNKEFFPLVSNNDWDKPETGLGMRASLDPAEDGSLITADLNLAHTQWTVNYRRSNHELYAENVLLAQEREMVRVAAMRGVVRAVAQTPIDTLLKDRDSVAAMAQRVAQAALKEMQSGIVIEQMTLNRKFAPANLLQDFAKVQAAQQEAGQKREEARTYALHVYNSVAGRGAMPLIDLINEYERAVELGSEEEAVRVLARIDALLEGESVEVEGEPMSVVVSGEVSQILTDARNDSFQTVSDARGELELFKAKLEQYNANPRLMVMREWASGMRAFYDRPFVQSFMVNEASGNAVQIRINEDPDIRRELERAQQLQQALGSDATREEARAQDRAEFDAEKAGG